MTDEDEEELKRALNNSNDLTNDYMILVKRGSLERLYFEETKLEKQAKLSSKEFADCLERKEKMIELLIKDFKKDNYIAGFNFMNEQDLYREYEQRAMIAIERRKNK